MNEESQQQQPPSQQALAEAAAQTMLSKISRYVAAEADLSLEDYRLLQAMNLAAADRYGSMADYSSGLVAFAERLRAKYDEMLPQLAQVTSMRSVGERACEAVVVRH